MTAPKWLTSAGFLGTISEETSLNFPIEYVGSNATFSVITGNLPPGLLLASSTWSPTTQYTVGDKILYNNINYICTATHNSSIAFNSINWQVTTTTNSINIIGSPFSVSDVIKSNFVIRAKNSSGVADRTFSFDVEGPRSPVWLTEEGFIGVGTSGEHYTVNQQIVDFQFTADVNVINSATKVRYYIADGDGTLPPGLTLDEDGRLSGYIEEILNTETDEGPGAGFDSESYDNFPYDFVDLINGQYIKPKFITKTYQFIVTATDGVATNTRLFKILLLDHNMFKVDTTWIRADSDYFANTSPLFTPTWLSPANLGSRRADNYQVIELNKYDPFPEEGPVQFTWNNKVNPNIRCLADSRFDLTGNQIYNIGPNQTTNRAGDTTIWIREATSAPQVGQYIYLPDFLPNSDTILYEISSVTPSPGEPSGFYQLTLNYNPTSTFDPRTGEITTVYNGHQLQTTLTDGLTMFIGSLSEHPPGFALNPTNGDMYGQLPYMPAYSKSYTFTMRVTKTDSFYGTSVYSDRVFTVALKGNIESQIAWDTDPLVGAIASGYQSELSIKAHHIGADIGVQYYLKPKNPDGSDSALPPGMDLNIDGSIAGKIPYNQLTYIDQNSFYLDDHKTTIDRQYEFTAQAKDNYNLSAVERTFFIQINDYDLTPYTNMYVQPFMNRNKRVDYRNFITSETLFAKDEIYRPYDPAFGIQYQIKLLIESGIQKLDLADYVISLQQYFYNKRFYFGDVKSVPATDIAGNTLYELVYVDIIDASSSANGIAKTVGITVNGKVAKVYPNVVENWRMSLETTPINGEPLQVDELLRPKFMNSIQKDTGAPLGFIKAVPICYAQPGKGASVVRKIQLTGFDFKLLDFEVDRIVVEQTLDSDTAKYLKFPRTGLVVPLPAGENDLAGADGVLWSFDDGNTLTAE
jgi:hypothetical protein